MDAYAVLTNRKRAIIALVHTVVFLLVAVLTFRSAQNIGLLTARYHGQPAPAILAGIFLIVSAILLYLFGISDCFKERLYFGFCATSATVGLLRGLFGDPYVPAGPHVRVAMLLCATITGFAILRNHTPQTENVLAD